ncbi:hypothetical protein M3Y95_00128000 [Aphelenchoides besseyi]|nr:hypothetical protein M3Y95_00128000 [Aphelenchoides besseyi]
MQYSVLEITTFGVCGTEVLSANEKKTTQILLYVGSGYVLFWLCLTILINLCCRTVGFNRLLDFMQEVALIVSFIFLGFFVLRPNWSGMCRATQIVLHAASTFVLVVAVVQAVFAAILIRGGASRIRGFVAFFFYLWPFAITAGYTCGVYFPLKDEYDNNGVHCFSEIYSKMFWTFAFPFAILIYMAIFIGQLAFTACDMTRKDVNEGQLFWAKKTGRGLPLTLLMFTFCFFTLLFAIDMQLIWLAAIYLAECVLFGPLVFVLHTYCYRKTARTLWRTRICFYKPCPQKQLEIANGEEKPLQEMPKNDLPPPLTEPVIPMVMEDGDPIPHVVNVIPVHPPAEFEVINPPENDVPVTKSLLTPPPNKVNNDSNDSETSPEDFYRWVTHGEDDVKAQQILFRKPEA